MRLLIYPWEVDQNNKYTYLIEMIVVVGIIITGVIVFVSFLIYIYYASETFTPTAKEIGKQVPPEQLLDKIRKAHGETNNHYLNARRIYVSGQVPIIEIKNTETSAKEAELYNFQLQQATKQKELLVEGDHLVAAAMELSEKAKSNFAYINN
jgi:hypothetical protein